jgi:elongation factor P
MNNLWSHSPAVWGEASRYSEHSAVLSHLPHHIDILSRPLIYCLGTSSKTGGLFSLIDTSDFRNGLHIIVDGDIYTIIEFMHVKPGKGGAFVRTKLKNVRTGAVLDKTFRAGERMEQAFLERKPMQFLYNQDDDYYLMDMDTYDQIMVRREQFGEGIKYLKENMEVTVLMHEGRVVGVEMPWFVELQVVETDPGVRGDTASGGSKPATLETGAVVRVPFHINVGDIIKVDTRTDQYLERVKTQ